MTNQITEKFTTNDIPVAPSLLEYFSFYVKLSGKINYLLEFFDKEKSIEIKTKSIEENNPQVYAGNFTKENFYKFHKFFRQFDTIKEIYNFLKNIVLEKITTIFFENNMIKLKIDLPSLIKNDPPLEVIIMLPKECSDINDILNTLIEKTKEIDILKKRIDYLYFYLNIKENNMEPFQPENMINDDFSCKIFDSIHSKIFKSNKEILFLFNHIENSLNKKIKNMELIYRCSKDGDNSKRFHSLCDGKENTLTLVTTSVGKRFGGFTKAEWNSFGSYSEDEKAFLFSFEYNEYYPIKKEQKDYAIYCHKNYGPAFGKGPDFYISSNCRNNSSHTIQLSYDYRGRTNTLVGTQKFGVIDYEVYQINFN